MSEQATQPDYFALTGAIARQLGEVEKAPLSQIRRALHVLGPERTQAFVTQALEVEAAGGMMVPDGSRRRTLGGVFFRLLRDQLPEAERQAIWPYRDWKAERQQRKARQLEAPAPPDPLSPHPLEDASVLATLTKNTGKATTVKVTIIGRPGQVVEKNGTVVVGMRDESNPSLPKGLPAPSDKPTTYMILISKKQWRKVADAVKNPDDKLIIEGYPRLDPRIAGGIVVYATNVTTRDLQAAKRQQQKEAPKKEVPA